MASPMVDLETYRNPFEPDEQWTLRRAFLERNWSVFTPGQRPRLLALAQCFQNIHTLGCKYPERVMQEVARLSVGLVEDKPKAKKLPFAKISFVREGLISDVVSALDAPEEDDDDDDDDEAAFGGDDENDANDDSNGKGVNIDQVVDDHQMVAESEMAISEARKTFAWDEVVEEEEERARLGFGARNEGVLSSNSGGGGSSSSSTSCSALPWRRGTSKHEDDGKPRAGGFGARSGSGNSATSTLAWRRGSENDDNDVDNDGEQRPRLGFGARSHTHGSAGGSSLPPRRDNVNHGSNDAGVVVGDDRPPRFGGVGGRNMSGGGSTSHSLQASRRSNTIGDEEHDRPPRLGFGARNNNNNSGPTSSNVLSMQGRTSIVCDEGDERPRLGLGARSSSNNNNNYNNNNNINNSNYSNSGPSGASLPMGGYGTRNNNNTSTSTTSTLAWRRGNAQRPQEDDDEEEERPRLGFGASNSIGGASGNSALPWRRGNGSGATANTFAFGKPATTDRPGFDRTSTPRSDTNGEFQFGIPYQQGFDTRPGGDFVFGKDSSTMDSAIRPCSNVAGAGKADYAAKLGFVKAKETPERKESDDLPGHLQSASLGGNLNRSAPRWNQSAVSQDADFSRQLEKLNAVRNELRDVRPPLPRARVEFMMLQVNMATSKYGGFKTVFDGSQIKLKFDDVCISTGKDEQAAHENFIMKVFDSQAWTIGNSMTGPVLELCRPAELAPRTGYALNHDRTAKRDGYTAGTSQPTQSVPGLPLDRPAQVYGQIIRNLREVRNTIMSDNFKHKVAMFGGPIIDVQSSLNMAFQLAKLRPVRDAAVPGTFLRPEFKTANQMTTCQLTFHGVILVESAASNKTEARLECSKKLYTILDSSLRLEIIEQDGRSWLRTSGNAQQNWRGHSISDQRMCPPVTVQKEYRELFIVRPAWIGDPQNLLQTFAAVNGLTLNFSTDAMLEKAQTVQICRLAMNTQPPITFEGRGETKQLARKSCVRVALQELIRNCCTIHVKQSIADGAQELDKDSLPLGLESHAVRDGLGRQLDEDNVGYRLLQNMGWRGGGLGGGTGVIEPVMLKDNMDGRGLGYEASGGTSKRFRTHVASTLRVFLRESDVFEELKFSPSFSNDERKEIHGIARRLGLKSKSQNRPEGRVLCISHNVDWRMILGHLKQSGASGKYELLPPGSWTLPDS